MTPEERDQLEDALSRFRADTDSHEHVSNLRYSELREACFKTIQAIDEGVMDASVCRQLRKVLDGVSSPIGQYGKFGQRVTTVTESNARRIAVGLPVTKFAGSRNGAQ